MPEIPDQELLVKINTELIRLQDIFPEYQIELNVKWIDPKETEKELVEFNRITVPEIKNQPGTVSAVIDRASERITVVSI